MYEQWITIHQLQHFSFGLFKPQHAFAPHCGVTISCDLGFPTSKRNSIKIFTWPIVELRIRRWDQTFKLDLGGPRTPYGRYWPKALQGGPSPNLENGVLFVDPAGLIIIFMHLEGGHYFRGSGFAQIIHWFNAQLSTFFSFIFSVLGWTTVEIK